MLVCWRQSLSAFVFLNILFHLDFWRIFCVGIDFYSTVKMSLLCLLASDKKYGIIHFLPWDNFFWGAAFMVFWHIIYWCASVWFLLCLSCFGYSELLIIVGLNFSHMKNFNLLFLQIFSCFPSSLFYYYNSNYTYSYVYHNIDTKTHQGLYRKSKLQKNMLHEPSYKNS